MQYNAKNVPLLKIRGPRPMCQGDEKKQTSKISKNACVCNLKDIPKLKIKRTRPVEDIDDFFNLTHDFLSDSVKKCLPPVLNESLEKVEQKVDELSTNVDNNSACLQEISENLTQKMNTMNMKNDVRFKCLSEFLQNTNDVEIQKKDYIPLKAEVAEVVEVAENIEDSGKVLEELYKRSSRAQSRSPNQTRSKNSAIRDKTELNCCENRLPSGNCPKDKTPRWNTTRNIERSVSPKLIPRKSRKISPKKLKPNKIQEIQSIQRTNSLTFNLLEAPSLEDVIVHDKSYVNTNPLLETKTVDFSESPQSLQEHESDFSRSSDRSRRPTINTRRDRSPSPSIREQVIQNEDPVARYRDLDESDFSRYCGLVSYVIRNNIQELIIGTLIAGVLVLSRFFM